MVMAMLEILLYIVVLLDTGLLVGHHVYVNSPRVGMDHNHSVLVS